MKLEFPMHSVVDHSYNIHIRVVSGCVRTGMAGLNHRHRA